MKISIITVCFNSVDVIETAIRSVLAQSYSDIEYIIIDGGSTDGTVEIIKNFEKQFFYFVTEPDSGIYDAMNKGIALATGDVIGILNSDDFYFNPYVLNEVIEVFSKNPKTDMVLGNVDFVSPLLIETPIRFYSSNRFEPWKMRFGFMPAHPAAFIRRSTYEKVGFYSLDYKIGADFEWFIRALLVNKLEYTKLNKTLVRMREGGVSSSGFKSYWLSSKDLLRALRKHSIYSNLLIILARLIVKLIQKILYKLENNK
tara:strand:- start:1119 stop:1889 length:771 start_codon:yes stop_codon:yes gene_type:complete